MVHIPHVFDKSLRKLGRAQVSSPINYGLWIKNHPKLGGFLKSCEVVLTLIRLTWGPPERVQWVMLQVSQLVPAP